MPNQPINEYYIDFVYVEQVNGTNAQIINN